MDRYNTPVQRTSIIQASTVIHKSALPFSSYCVNAASAIERTVWTSWCHGTSFLADKTLPPCTLTTQTARRRILFEKRTVLQLLKKLLVLYETRVFIGAFSGPCHERNVQPTLSHAVSLRTSFHLTTDLPRDPLHASFTDQDFIHTSDLFHACYIPGLTHPLNN